MNSTSHPCPVDTFNPSEGGVNPGVCQQCPASQSAALGSLPGSAQCTRCADTFYRSALAASLQNCSACPSHATCTNDATLATISLARDHWRASNRTSSIYDCTEGFNTASTCLGGMGSLCEAHHSGPLCQVCTEPRRFFSSITRKCIACPDIGSRLGIAAGVLGGIGAALGLSLAARRVLSRRMSSLSSIARSLWLAVQRAATKARHRSLIND